ncbi:DUF1326 domain-containing protein [Actinoplanes sp. NBRC 103695]|uniref:DUF1326 domain-containing protein n=1 Tax=Actinoplanes sp. NBRC 103695 TaxID=3032202 RepID=UPI0024A251C7|nr:DUF1326 domain-containing protein [Actinoplanes sp. NBRC 103695]GLY99069.1 hypothetical protein Acsp02_63230 [Actinoplanes sp. NBRC 103695]
MGYLLTGVFTEACDCTLVCPCWLDDAPEEDHCTGLFAWRLDEGSAIDGVDVGKLSVVSVSTHAGGRRDGDTATAIFVDENADERQFELLTAAFAGDMAGPLGELAGVSGVVVQRLAARIEMTADESGWHLLVGLPGAGPIEATGAPHVLLDEDEPLTLRHTALDRELSVAGDDGVAAHRTERLAVRVPALAGAYLDVSGRSAMRGRFRYADPLPPRSRAR